MIRTCAKTDIGQRRLMNQDFIFVSEEPLGCCPNLFLVADGMGGEKAGDYASRFVVERLSAYLRESKTDSPVTALTEGICEVNRQLHEISMRNFDLRGTGTTLVAAMVLDGTLHVANVGDSRLYLLHRGKLTQITKDHSYVEELVARGMLVRGSEAYLAQKNMITRAIGAEENVRVDFFDEQLEEGDLILLCSDGLTNMLTDEEIRRLLVADGSLAQKTALLVQRANENGGSDNISVILSQPRIQEVSVC